MLIDYDDEYWIEVHVSKERFIKLNVDEFYKWATSSGIAWNLRIVDTTGNEITPRFLFRREDDIIAFRLKFGL